MFLMRSFFVFKQKTGYEMRISDWSSHVCSSDLDFRPGTLESMGMDWESLHARNPRLILVRITGFGQDGPLAQRPCFDGAAQAISGLMSMTEIGRASCRERVCQYV